MLAEVGDSCSVVADNTLAISCLDWSQKILSRNVH